MYSENGVLPDLDEVREAIENADVFTVGFPLFPARLLVDTRSRGVDGPLIRIVDPASSVQERFFELGRLRPQFGLPKQFMFFVWPNSVGFLEQSGVLDAIERRCATGDNGGVATMCADAVTTLRQLERDATLAALRRESCKTLWSADQAATVTDAPRRARGGSAA